MTGALAAPFVLPVIGAAARPLMKELLKQGVLASIAARERFEVTAEGVTDLVAEIRAELEHELAERKAPSSAPIAAAPAAHKREPIGEA